MSDQAIVLCRPRLLLTGRLGFGSNNQAKTIQSESNSIQDAGAGEGDRRGVRGGRNVKRDTLAVFLVCLVCLVHLVDPVCLVYLVRSHLCSNQTGQTK